MTMLGYAEKVVTPHTFTKQDRCDRCGAEAYARVSKENVGELMFCGHHFRASEAQFIAGGWTIVDQTDRIS